MLPLPQGHSTRNEPLILEPLQAFNEDMEQSDSYKQRECPWNLLYSCTDPCLLRFSTCHSLGYLVHSCLMSVLFIPYVFLF